MVLCKFIYRRILGCFIESSLVSLYYFSICFILCIYSQTSGDISFREIEFHLLKLYGDKNDAIKKELSFACSKNLQCVNERLNQIQQYRQLGAYSRGAETMINIKEMFELTGDFSPVEILVDLVSLFAELPVICRFKPSSVTRSVNIFFFLFNSELHEIRCWEGT